MSLAALLLAHGVASAQLPVAPAPHPTLDELVKEYQRWGLPIPSADSELVRLSWGNSEAGWDQLAFRHPKAKPGDAPRYLMGSEWWLPNFPNYPPTSEMLVKPVPSALEGARGGGSDWLCVAVQCKIRGWDSLARAAYEKARSSLGQWTPVGEEPPTVIEELHATAWRFWENKLTERQSDRKKILTNLNSLVDAGYKFPAGTRAELRAKWLLEDLELTVTPRKSKPGSIEALIDDLTEDWTDPDDRENETNHVAYWKLVELGYDAVPALLEHLKDNRLTRSKLHDWKSGEYIGVVRVSQPVESILNQLSGGRFETEYYGVTGDRIIEPKDHRWLEMVRCGGEEAWLLDNVIPEDAEERDQIPNEIILRIIRAKYPQRLKDVYQTVVLHRPIVRSDPITKAILASKLPLKDKVAILEQGVTSKEYKHRVAALEALAEIDGVLFRKHLLQSLKGIPADITFREDAYNPELWVIGLLRKTDDRDCWQALTDLTRRVASDTRQHLINSVGGPVDPSDLDIGRRECLRYLLGFLNDTEVGDVPWHGPQAVRDFATTRLALMLGFATRNEVKLLQSPRELSILRNRVRELAEPELARPAK